MTVLSAFGCSEAVDRALQILAVLLGGRELLATEVSWNDFLVCTTEPAVTALFRAACRSALNVAWPDTGHAAGYRAAKYLAMPMWLAPLSNRATAATASNTISESGGCPSGAAVLPRIVRVLKKR